jgi:hypothetical protein
VVEPKKETFIITEMAKMCLATLAMVALSTISQNLPLIPSESTFIN